MTDALPAGPDAVLFDMDGLLVGTEEVWFTVETEVMRRLDGPWGPEHQAALVGGPMQRTTAYMLDLAGSSDATPADVERWLLDGMEHHLRTYPVPWMPGARELLEEVAAAGLPVALVSSSSRRLVDAVLDAVGRAHFRATVSSDDVTQTKPHPDPYLAAAAALGVDPTRCVAIEDSATGATSARAAGCVTLVVPSVAQVDDGVAHAVVDSLTEVDLGWLRDLMDRRLRATPS